MRERKSRIIIRLNTLEGSPQPMITTLSGMHNIQPAMVPWLKSVGITTPEELTEMGAVAAYRKLKDAYPHQVNLTVLWTLHGAINGIPLAQIPREDKAKLKSELDSGK